MVYDKKRSGDPDYDDKQPPAVHTGKIVTAGDGREVLVNPAAGPVDPVTGQHVNLDDPKGDELDNRPAPGEAAKDTSEVQTYDSGASPAERDTKADAEASQPATGRSTTAASTTGTKTSKPRS